MGKLGVTLATYLQEERRESSLQNLAPELICAVIMVELLDSKVKKRSAWYAVTTGPQQLLAGLF